MTDKFASCADSVAAPARSASALVPHDVNALPNTPKALYVGGGGSIVCRLVDDGADVTFVGVPAGAFLPVRASHVRATGTTATSIVALY